MRATTDLLAGTIPVVDALILFGLLNLELNYRKSVEH